MFKLNRKTKNYPYLILFSLFSLFCLIPQFTSAQNKQITVSFKNEPLVNAIEKIKDISGYSFAYQPDILPPDYTVTKSFINEPIEQVLSEILRGTGLTFQILDEQIILKKKEKQKKFTLSGYISDESSGQRLINANIYEKASLTGTISNNYGYYNLSLPEGAYTLVYSFIGMKAIEKQVILDKNIQVDIDLEPNLEIEEVVVYGKENTALIDESSLPGKMSISPVEMVEFPTIMAEPDVVKYVQLLPGMQAGTEANGAIYVRGGGPLQNLFLLDNVPIYNCYHMLGLFSVFNSDIIGNTDVYKSAFPSRYGGRLSSVLDMKSRDGNFRKIKGKVSLGMISSKLALEGPVIKDKTSFYLAGRLGYYNLYGIYLPGILKDRDKLENYNFYDVNAKVTHKFSNNSKLYFSVYMGKDIGETINETVSDYDTYSYEQNIDGQNWSNLIGTVGWAGKITNRLFSNIQLGASYYEYNGYLKDSTYEDYNNQISSSLHTVNLNNSVSNNFGSIDFQLTVFPKLKTNFGYKYTLLELKSENRDRENQSRYNSHVIYNYDDTITSHYKHETEEQNAYIDFEISWVKNLLLTAGVHASFYYADDYSNQTYQPRMTASWEMFRGVFLKGSYSQMVQHIHLLGATHIKMASDLLVSAVNEAPSETANHYSCGISVFRTKYLRFHIDAYYKEMNNLVNFEEGTSYFTESSNWVDKIITGKGTSKGIELLIEKPKGKLTGWLGYTLSETDRKFENINMGEIYPFRYHHQHYLSIAAKYKISDKWNVSANWLFHSGNRETIPSIFYWETNNLLEPKMGGNYYDGTKVFYNPKNGYKNPDYHRLDISVNFNRKNRLGNATWSLSIYNVYNRLNVYASTYGQGYAHVIGNVGYTTRTIEEYKLFGIIPSISYSLSF